MSFAVRYGEDSVTGFCPEKRGDNNFLAP